LESTDKNQASSRSKKEASFGSYSKSRTTAGGLNLSGSLSVCEMPSLKSPTDEDREKKECPSNLSPGTPPGSEPSDSPTEIFYPPTPPLSPMNVSEHEKQKQRGVLVFSSQILEGSDAAKQKRQKRQKSEKRVRHSYMNLPDSLSKVIVTEASKISRESRVSRRGSISDETTPFREEREPSWMEWEWEGRGKWSVKASRGASGRDEERDLERR